MRSKDLPVRTGGVKHDDGKPRPDLILRTMARAMLAVSEVAAFGAAKYDDDNWLLVDDAKKRYADAKARHMLQGAFESHDDESGLLHAAHEAWNALALLELKLREPKHAPLLHNWTDETEERIDVIGQNGNDGEHYRDALIGKRASGGVIISFEGANALVMGERDIIGMAMSWDGARKACHLFEHNGYGDWFLPSKDQLNLAWINREKLGCLELKGCYWSASQSSDCCAWHQNLSDGHQATNYKAAHYKISPVRRVKIENLEFEDSEAAPEVQPSSSAIVTKDDLLRGDWWCADTSETARKAFELRGFNVADQWELEDLDGCRLTGKESVTRFKGMSKTKDLREITLVDGEFYYCKAQPPGDE